MRHRAACLLPSLAALAVLATRDPTSADHWPVHRLVEQRRLRAHFDSVDAELRTRDVAGLSPAQRESRRTLSR
jgi:hypothetical protein